MNEDQATTLVIPGEPLPLGSTPGAGLVGEILAFGLPLALALFAAWAASRRRSRRKVDPRELAFRRIALAQGWSRSQVRALRRAASAAGLASPVGMALSPALTARALAEAAATGRRGSRAGRV